MAIVITGGACLVQRVEWLVVSSTDDLIDLTVRLLIVEIMYFHFVFVAAVLFTVHVTAISACHRCLQESCVHENCPPLAGTASLWTKDLPRCSSPNSSREATSTRQIQATVLLVAFSWQNRTGIDTKNNRLQRLHGRGYELRNTHRRSQLRHRSTSEAHLEPARERSFESDATGRAELTASQPHGDQATPSVTNPVQCHGAETACDLARTAARC